jgi:hypothetical protein
MLRRRQIRTFDRLPEVAICMHGAAMTARDEILAALSVA